MMERKIVIALFALLLSACNSTSDVTASAEQEGNVDGFDCMQKNPGNEDACLTKEQREEVGMKCKKIQVTGTRFKKRECTTLAQRKARQEAAFEGARKLQGMGATNLPAENREGGGI